MKEVVTLPVVALTHTNEECLLCCGLSHKITEQLLLDLSLSSKQLRTISSELTAEVCGGVANGPVLLGSLQFHSHIAANTTGLKLAGEKRPV